MQTATLPKTACGSMAAMCTPLTRCHHTLVHLPGCLSCRTQQAHATVLDSVSDQSGLVIHSRRREAAFLAAWAQSCRQSGTVCWGCAGTGGNWCSPQGRSSACNRNQPCELPHALDAMLLVTGGVEPKVCMLCSELGVFWNNKSEQCRCLCIR